MFFNKKNPNMISYQRDNRKYLFDDGKAKTGTKDKTTNNDRPYTTQKTKDWAIRDTLKHEGELRTNKPFLLH